MLKARFLTLLALFTSPALAAHDPAQSLKVLTYNVWDVGFAGGEYTPERLEKICARLQAEAAKPGEGWDVVLIQELWPSSRSSALDNCGYPHSQHVERFRARMAQPHMWILRATGDLLDTGIRVLSRYPLGEPTRHTYSRNGYLRYTLNDGDWLARKSVMLVPLEHPTLGRVWIGNTHLVSRNEHTNYFFQRLQQVRELGAFVREVTRGEPTILGGDLNFGPEIPGMQSIAAEPQIWSTLLTLELPNFSPAQDSEQACTYCYGENSWVKQSEGRQKIDHLLATEHFVSAQAKVVLKEKVELSTQAGIVSGVSLSDHFGFEAVFTNKR